MYNSAHMDMCIHMLLSTVQGAQGDTGDTGSPGPQGTAVSICVACLHVHVHMYLYAVLYTFIMYTYVRTYIRTYTLHTYRVQMELMVDKDQLAGQ